MAVVYIPVLGGPLDGKVWPLDVPAPPVMHGHTLDENATLYFLREYPLPLLAGQPLRVYVAETLSVDEGADRLLDYLNPRRVGG